MQRKLNGQLHQNRRNAVPHEIRPARNSDLKLVIRVRQAMYLMATEKGNLERKFGRFLSKLTEKTSLSETDQTTDG
jgi:hypothetical protein